MLRKYVSEGETPSPLFELENGPNFIIKDWDDTRKSVAITYNDGIGTIAFWCIIPKHMDEGQFETILLARLVAELEKEKVYASAGN